MLNVCTLRYQALFVGLLLFCEGTKIQCWNALRLENQFVIILHGLEAVV